MNPNTLFKCLADDTRRACILLIDQEQELCVCELTDTLRLSQPKISRHLAHLRKCELLKDRKQGQWVFYSLNPELSDWVLKIIQQTAIGDTDLLKQLTANLEAMSGRPDRCYS